MLAMHTRDMLRNATGRKASMTLAVPRRSISNVYLEVALPGRDTSGVDDGVDLA